MINLETIMLQEIKVWTIY